MDVAITVTRDYLKVRKQFGATLGSFQALQHRMADMLVEAELARSTLYQGIAALNAAPKRRLHALSAMKAVVSTAAMFVGRNAVQLHGGIGMTEEYSIGHYYRRLFVIASQFGDEGYHLKRAALLKPAIKAISWMVWSSNAAVASQSRALGKRWLHSSVEKDVLFAFNT